MLKGSVKIWMKSNLFWFIVDKLMLVPIRWQIEFGPQKTNIEFIQRSILPVSMYQKVFQKGRSCIRNYEHWTENHVELDHDSNTSPTYEFSAPEMQSYVRTVFLHAVDKSIRQLSYGLCIFESPIIDTATQLLDVIWQIIICKSRVCMGKINDLVLLQYWCYFIPIVGCLVHIGTTRISGTLQCQKKRPYSHIYMWILFLNFT